MWKGLSPKQVGLQSCLSREAQKESHLQLTPLSFTLNIRTGRSTLDLSSLCSSGDSHGQSEDSSQQISRQYLSPRLDTPSSSPYYSRSSGSEKDLSKSNDHGYQH